MLAKFCRFKLASVSKNKLHSHYFGAFRILAGLHSGVVTLTRTTRTVT